jgi:hypothetical protein
MTQRNWSLVVSICLLLLLLATAWQAKDFEPLAAYFPVVVALLGAILAAINLLGDWSARNALAEPQDDAGFARSVQAGAVSFGGVILYVAGIILAGFFPASVVFLFLVLFLRTDFGLLWSTLLAIGSLVALYYFGNMMLIEFPVGLLEQAIRDAYFL